MAGGGYERGDHYIPDGIQRPPHMAPRPLPSRGDFPKDEAANPGMSRMFWPISGAIHPFKQSILLSLHGLSSHQVSVMLICATHGN
jgi:hypothetical protein